MKSPLDLQQRLRRQWNNSATRVLRLLGGMENWPVVVPISKPKPTTIRDNLDVVKRHIESWRRIKVGEVTWEAVQYRSTAAPVDVPVQWILPQPTDWVAACANASVSGEFDKLSKIVSGTDQYFHEVFVRRRWLWREKSVEEVIQASRLALRLKRGFADGRPLRTLSIEGIDTKFFERNSALLTALLDARFDDEVSKLGLETFLKAFVERDHWLLVMDLDGTLLPFRKQRVASTELVSALLPARRVLIVENETCQHQLPELSDTIAILGAGFNLDWTSNPQLRDKDVGYWGDIDTWGFQFLAKVRQNVNHVCPLLMGAEIFESNRASAVAEPVVAGFDCPTGLTVTERQLYDRLLTESKGRLEQEFLPEATIHKELHHWASDS
jgi:hypothetical protein